MRSLLFCKMFLQFFYNVIEIIPSVLRRNCLNGRLFEFGFRFRLGATLCRSKLLIQSQRHFMGSPRLLWVRSAVPPVMLFVILLAVLLNASDKKDALQYGVGLMANIPASESEVVKAVDEV